MNVVFRKVNVKPLGMEIEKPKMKGHKIMRWLNFIINFTGSRVDYLD